MKLICKSDSHSVFTVKIEQQEKNLEIPFINKCEEISEEALEKIFEKFYRVDEARTSEIEGVGLGLTIANKIIELHNGELTAEKSNEYVKFKITLNKLIA